MTLKLSVYSCCMLVKFCFFATVAPNFSVKFLKAAKISVQHARISISHTPLLLSEVLLCRMYVKTIKNGLFIFIYKNNGYYYIFITVYCTYLLFRSICRQQLSNIVRF